MFQIAQSAQAIPVIDDRWLTPGVDQSRLLYKAIHTAEVTGPTRRHKIGFVVVATVGVRHDMVDASRKRTEGCMLSLGRNVPANEIRERCDYDLTRVRKHDANTAEAAPPTISCVYFPLHCKRWHPPPHPLGDNSRIDGTEAVNSRVLWAHDAVGK